MRRPLRSIAALLACTSLVCSATVSAQGEAGEDRVGRTAAETHPPRWPANPQAPAGAPNVLVIMTDDVGYGVTSAFGGPVPTEAFSALARQGLRYNRFNTSALCSPTRASLLTGREPHNVNMGNVANIATGYDGYTSVIPDSAATVADVLKTNGYNTAMIGKGHVTPEWEMSQAGPFDRWPSGLGFEYYYGFLGADTSMFDPNAVENEKPVAVEKGPGYHFEKDMADKAIDWLETQNASAPDKPFFMYYAPGLAHTPHHAPQEWLDRFKGKFDAGWDKVREETFERQKEMGLIPAGSELSPRPDSLPAWASLSAEQKKVYARLMEAFAASVAYSDHQTGRVIDWIRNSGEFDNTMIVYIQGDNGSSAEGGLNGLAYEQSMITGHKETFEELAARYDEIGGPNLYNHFPAAWAWAMNSPFPWWKQIASQAGGVRNGMVISWPEKITDGGSVRDQYAYVSDIAPTLYEAIGVTPPETFQGTEQQPIDGISLAYSFNSPEAPTQRTTQVYEMMENFGVYHDGWVAGTLPKRTAWDVGAGNDRNTDAGPDSRTWTLFNLDTDFTTARDLSRSRPEKLKEMQDLFWAEARRNNVLPIHDYSEGTEGRPTLGGNRKQFVYTNPVSRIPEDSAPRTIGHSFAIDADLDFAGEDRGVIVTQGGRFGGYAFYLKDGYPVFHYNALGDDQFQVRGDTPVPAGKHRVTARFAADRERPGTPGTLALMIDGKPVGSGRIARTVQGWMSHTEGFDVGMDTITSVNGDYTIKESPLTADLEQVTFRIGTLQ